MFRSIATLGECDNPLYNPLVDLAKRGVCLSGNISEPFMIRDVPPKESEPMVQIKVTIPQKILDNAQRLASDHGLTNGDFYRDCFIDGLAAQFEKYTKAEVYKKVKKGNERGT